jgi:hypothetical protein
MPRHKQFFGFATGDLVRAVVPTGKKQGTHTGRVAVRATGSFNITTAQGTVQGVNRKHVRLLQRADGYAYTTRSEEPPAAGGVTRFRPGGETSLPAPLRRGPSSSPGSSRGYPWRKLMNRP